MNLVRHYYRQNEEAERVQVFVDYGTNMAGAVHLTAVEGKPFRTCSFLRHHGGKNIETNRVLYVPISEVEVDVIPLCINEKNELTSTSEDLKLDSVHESIAGIEVMMLEVATRAKRTYILPWEEGLLVATEAALVTRWGKQIAGEMQFIEHDGMTFQF